LEQVKRALDLGAQVIWWPTSDLDLRESSLELPPFHNEVLSVLANRPRTLVATGHLGYEPSLTLVRDSRQLSIPVVLTHPFNPSVGIGKAHVLEFVEMGAFIEIDAYSLHLYEPNEADVLRTVNDLGLRGAALILSSDGGQAATGNPFRFLANMLSRGEANGHSETLSAAARRTNDMMEWLVNGAN
jgi:hypothetical protein